MPVEKPDEPPSRGHPAHPSPVTRHNEPVILLVTVATLHRRRVLAERDAVSALTEAWRQAQRWAVGYYLVMPDHVHLFCSPSAWPTDTVKSWVAYWKRLAGQTNPYLKSAFVYDCWDTQMRSQDHYARKLEYVAMNPVRAGLAKQPGGWPFCGHLNELAW
jgi:putative transposase